MTRGVLIILVVTVLSDVAQILNSAKAMPMEGGRVMANGEQRVTGSGEAAVTEVTSSGDLPVTGSGDVTGSPGELAPLGEKTGQEGCVDDGGLFHTNGSKWHLGCEKFCECLPSVEGFAHTCTPPRCAIPMLTPGCKIVPNPRRNDTTGENCCDAVECTPMNCRDNSGREHPLYASWHDGELDCFCQYNYELDTAETVCSLFPPEVPLPMPRDSDENILSSLELRDSSSEGLPDETLEVCKDDSGKTYAVGQSWKVGCNQECSCVHHEERLTIECSPFPCAIPQILPGCKLIPNPEKDEANSINCCDKVVCDSKECTGEGEEKHAVNTLWYESNKTCICVLNYNTNQAETECRNELNQVLL